MAFGPFQAQALRYMDLSSGVRTEFGTLLPPGGMLACYLRSTGAQSGDDADVKRRLVTTLNQACSYVRAGKPDYIMVMPDHVESISTANQLTNLVAGTRIIGMGVGANRPTFTWTTATASVLLNKDNVEWSNCILNLDGGTTATTNAAPITISGNANALKGNLIRMGTDASNIVTIGITTTAAADDLTISDNFMYGATAAGCTTMLQFVGADRLRFLNNIVTGATTATGVGVVRFLTTASTNIVVDNCRIANNIASSTQAVTGMAGVTGTVDNTLLQILSGAASGIANAWGTVGNLVFGANVTAANAVGLRAVAFGTATT